MTSQPNVIQISSPIRVDLAGGTVDCWPLCQIIPNATTVNFGLSLFTHVELTERHDLKILIESSDVKLKLEFQSLKEFLNDSSGQVGFYQKVIAYFNPQKGFSIKTSSESPVGAGLGGSSSLVISMIKAFKLWLKLDLKPQLMVDIACNLETQMMGKPAGSQDYYPAIYGGLNVIDYKPQGPQWRVIDVALDWLGERGSLVYTGRAHHSGLNNWDVIQRALNGDASVIAALTEVANLSHEFLKALEEKNMDRIFSVFQAELKARLKLSPSFSSEEIEKLAGFALTNGSALKICGAGGGGCVFAISPDQETKTRFEKQAMAWGFKILPSRPWKDPACPM